MSVKIRLRRMGAKHQPSYRIVVADSRSPRDGRYIDQVGFYNPLMNPAIIDLNQEKAVDWLRRGAVPSDTVAKLFSKFDIDPQTVRKPGYTHTETARRVTAPTVNTSVLSGEVTE